MHLRAGRALEGLPSLPVAQLARHFREAGETAEWCKYAEQAADLALSSGDETIAIAHLHALVAGADLPAGSLVRLMDKIPFTSFTGPAQFRELVVAIRSVLSSKLLAPEEEAAVRFHLGRLLLQMEEWSEGRAELERAIPHLAHEPIYAARAMILLGWPRGTTCPVSVHLHWLRRAARLTAPTARADRLPFAVDRASALLMLGHDAGWADAPRILDDAADDAASRRHVARGHLNMGNSAMTWGRYNEARNRLAKASVLAVTHHYARLHEEILLTQVHLDWFTGVWDGIAERAGSLAGNDDAQPVMRLEAALVVGLLHAATGAAAEAEERLEVVLAETLRLGELEHSMQSAAALSRLRLASGRGSDALHASDTPIGILVSKGIWLWATDLAPARVAALVATSGMEQAAELVDAFARGLRSRNAPAPRAGLMTCRAMLAEAGGEHARAAASFARAAAAWQALPRPYDALLARERQACCLLAAGRPETALPLLGQVRAELITLGALGDADRVVRTLREHGVAAKGPQRGGKRGLGDQLSPRELEVVRLLARGQTDREIAEVLVVSPKTVAYHLDSARRKLKAQSRTALAVTALAAGLVSGQPPAPGNQPAGTGAKTGNSPSS
jgi:DNA-binding CsgD family transcriptional regulator/tetratricopeptide (TPR) repeat protein